MAGLRNDENCCKAHEFFAPSTPATFTPKLVQSFVSATHKYITFYSRVFLNFFLKTPLSCAAVTQTPAAVKDLAGWVNKIVAQRPYSERNWKEISKGRWEAKNHGLPKDAEMRSSILCPLPVPGENKRPGESGTDEPQRKTKRTKRAARKPKSQIVLSSEEEDDKEDDDEEQPELVRHRSIRPDPEPVVHPVEAPLEDVRVEDASEPSAPARASPGTDHPVTSPPSSSTWGQLPDDIPMMGGSFETFFDGVPSSEPGPGL
ncbi:PREDICTED: uncharacterized protein LOC109233733 [Nicotiana attenuata]|uniref:uncharacterized protein LOC109233733 n=1 Tax=Nicotiana attenuata TaxID=49451 RepID=UPI000904B366|nr:PREDICTED: uncharacterized protein LOC109233733 [Nicotiana attenuata]